MFGMKGSNMDDSTFWLTLWLGIAAIVATTIISTTYIANNKDVKMATAGYIQKVVVTGNPNDTYSRNIQVVWVPKEGKEKTPE